MTTTGLLDGYLASTDNTLETFNVIWADSSVNECANEGTRKKIRNLFNHLIKFDNSSQCKDYIEHSSPNARFFVIISGRFGREIAGQLQKCRQVSSMYVYCMDKKANQTLAEQYSKIRVVVTSDDELVEAIQNDLTVRLQLDEPFTFNIMGKLNTNFSIYFQLFLQCLVRMKFNTNHQNELLTLLETKCKDNDEQMKIIQEYREDSSSEKLLSWFTQSSFFNQILSKALLNADFQRIFLFHSFISQIYYRLKQIQPTSPISIYRSQILSNDELKNLKININQFISFNSFYFAVVDRTKALETLNAIPSSADFQRVLFEIDIDSTLVSIKPFARVGASEILLMVAPIFQLKSITPYANQITIVKMSLCTDEEYKSILHSIPMKVEQTNEQTNLRTLAKIFWKMGQIDLATIFYNRFISQTSANDPLLKLVYDDLGMMNLEQNSYQQSLDWFKKSIDIKKQNPSPINDTFIDYFPDLGSKISRPPCPQIDSCYQLNDEAHMRVYFHHTACRYGGQCESINNKDHANKFIHPDFCSKQGECTDMSETHLLDYRHVPLCKDGVNCPLLFKGDNVHRMAYRHCKNNCKLRSYCPDFHNNEHMEEENHPCKPPCPYTPYKCQYYDQLMSNANNEKTDPYATNCAQHCFKYSHVCPFGRYCTNLTNKTHCETNLHIFRIECPQGEHCQWLNDPNHSNSYSHKTIRDIRCLCQHSKDDCPNHSDKKHLKIYRHSGHVHSVGVARCLGLNKQINFLQNQNEMIDNIQKYIKTSNWNPSTITVPDSLLRWIRALQPVHRCNKTIFESILLHGHVMSREHMNSLRESHSVAKAIRNHKVVQQLFSKVSNTRLQQTFEEYFHILVDEHFGKHQGKIITQEQTKRLKEIEIVFSTLQITDDDIKTVRKLVTDIAEASFQLHSSQTGIGWQADTDLGTNNHVFAILGPHAGYYYGDIIIVFRQEIMHHPDSNFSIHAATTFHTSGNAYKWRPWLKDPGALEKRIEHFHHNKLHCSMPGYEIAAAYELMAIAGLSKKSTTNIDHDTIAKRWMDLDAHQVFEAHLPLLIPLDYIEKIYMAESTFKSLSSPAQQSAKTIFGDILCITSHQLSANTPAFQQPIDVTRKPYQTFVLTDIFKAIEQRSDAFPSYQGIFLTLASSHFRDFVHIPMTISQALSQVGSSDIVYIYWEALKGDMSLVLTDEMIDTENHQKNLQCLTCHIAKWLTNNVLQTSTQPTINYHEGYSYIGTHHPYAHYHLINDGKFQASSNAFHRGCNTDEYIIYNLVLNRKTSQVTLAIVGSNALYNQKKLTFTFNKKEFDLTKLEYVQISAGGISVPVRNFVIQSKPIEAYHPTIDTDYIKANISTIIAPTVPKPLPKPVLKEVVTPESAKLKPCSNSIYCQLQYQDTDEGKKHIAEFSHPCRFSELCRKKEAHLVHIPHLVSPCPDDDKCTKLGDPIHRAQYRHKDLPDYLIPCKFQDKCKAKTSEHRMKYFHGEKVPLPS